MNDRLLKIIEQIVPFLVLGVAIALVIGLFIMLSYVLVWGILIGGILWLIYAIKNWFKGEAHQPKSKGRIIEHDKNK